MRNIFVELRWKNSRADIESRDYINRLKSYCSQGLPLDRFVDSLHGYEETIRFLKFELHKNSKSQKKTETINHDSWLKSVYSNYLYYEEGKATPNFVEDWQWYNDHPYVKYQIKQLIEKKKKYAINYIKKQL